MSAPKKIIHRITEEEMLECWKFGLKYFLDPTKSIQNRTVGQNRGLGGILDSFMNKIVESAVCKEIEKLNKDIKCFPDFEIHKLKKGKTEPDIFKIKDEDATEKRDPNLYVEIKYITDSDHWLGPKADEVESILNNEYGITDKAKMFYVYGEIVDAKRTSNDRESSILGAYLKKFLPKDGILKKFHSIRNLSVEIKYVFSIKDIEKFGVHFPAGGYMTNPEIFSEPAKSTRKRILKKMNENVYTSVPTNGKKFPRETGTFLTKTVSGKSKKIRLPYPDPFGDVKFSGEIELHRENHSSTVNHFFRCLSKVTVSHKVLGNWKFNKGDVWNYKIMHSGRDPELRKNNTFVARRNKKVTEKLCASRLKEIARKI